MHWYEWECPSCRRYGEVDAKRSYTFGEHWRDKCPVCGKEVVVECYPETAFVAYSAEIYEEDEP